MRRVTLAEKLSVSCPKCGARAGAECWRIQLLCVQWMCPVIEEPHPQRREAFLVMLKRAGDNVSAWRDSPAEGYPDVEPEDEV